MSFSPLELQKRAAGVDKFNRREGEVEEKIRKYDIIIYSWFSFSETQGTKEFSSF